MSNNYKIGFDLNKLLKNIRFKKQYITNLKNKNSSLVTIRETNYKSLSSTLLPLTHSLSQEENLVTYIIDINFLRSNTFVHVTDFLGNSKFFYSSGSFNYSGRNKKSRYLVFRDVYRVLVSKLKFLKGKPIALHLKNVGYNRFWIVKKLKKKFFIKSLRLYTTYPYNGCRKPKMRRKKFKKIVKNEEMAEGFKAADCKSVELFSS